MGLFGFGHSGSSPSPFDALDGRYLAGPQGSHPLHDVDAAMLLRPARGPIDGGIELDAPSTLVGGVVEGRIRLRSQAALDGRAAGFRLVGLRLVEERKSRTVQTGKNQSHTEQWVEANGSIFEVAPFIETQVPASLPAGAAWETRFRVPAPRLGPPSAHLGEAIVAWALEVRWDQAWSEDPVLATLLEVRQHPDLLRAGVGRQGGISLLDEVGVNGATIRIHSGLPARIGSPLVVEAHWPAAPDGRGARLELRRRTNAPNGEEGMVATADLGLDALRTGGAAVSLALPEGLAPSFDGAGLQVAYVIRVVVDRPFQPDAVIERPVGMA